MISVVAVAAAVGISSAAADVVTPSVDVAAERNNSIHIYIVQCLLLLKWFHIQSMEYFVFEI